MDVRKYEIYFECCPGYLTSEQSERVRYLLYKKNSSPTVLPHKNRAVNSNAFHDNRHM